MAKPASISFFPQPSSSAEGECEFIGQDYELISEGEYEALFDHFETSLNFASPKLKANDGAIPGGKIYLWFRIDPHGSAGLPMDKEHMLFQAFNASAVFLPAGKNQRYRVGARSKFAQQMKFVFGKGVMRARFSPNRLANILLKVRVKTVRINNKQRKHSEEEKYSCVTEIIEVL